MTNTKFHSVVNAAMTGGLSPDDTKAGRLQRACLELLRQHEADGALPTSNRFIYYELVQRGIVEKHKPGGGGGGRRSDQDTTEALFRLREVGLVPWEWIVDETRSFTAWRYADSVLSYLEATVPLARIDLWDDHAPPVIITESRSLAGVLEGLAREYLVPITSTNGQAGGHLRTDVAPNLQVGQRVLYLGDFDWQCGQIEANTRGVLERLVGWLDWGRLAITEEQVRRYSLPVISKPDRRYKPARYHDAVETEALGQNIIVGIVRDHLNSILPEPIEDVQERESDQCAAATIALRRLRSGADR
jgi:hypothetical protein